MKHFTAGAWSDYVRGALPEAESAAMRRHLDGGCGRCAAWVQSLSSVLELAHFDRRLELPDGALRTAKATFGVGLRAAAREPMSALGLIFDSRTAPAAAGTRSAASTPRRLVYQSENLALDLQLTAEEGAEVTVHGGLTDRRGEELRDVPVFLLVGGKIRARVTTDAAGDFQLDADAAGELRLFLVPPGGDAVDVALPRP